MRVRRVALRGLAGPAPGGAAPAGPAPGGSSSRSPAPALTVAVWDASRDRWLPLAPALDAAEDNGNPALAAAGSGDLVAFLAAGEAARAAALALAEEVADRDFAGTFDLDPAQLPFVPRSLRAFATSERHWVQAARGLVRRNLPQALTAIEAYERVARRTFPALRPKRLFYEQPSCYFGNHLTCYPHGATLPWPSFTGELDFELELAAVLARPLRDATVAEAEAAIGGFVIFNDLSARDVQWREHRQGLFGPLGKAKSFANALGAEVVTADELLPRLGDLRGRIRVNGETWNETTTAEQLHSFPAMIAHASSGEQLFPGELLSSGTLPGGCGLELDRRLSPGDELELELDHLGTLRNRIAARGEPVPPPPGS